MWLCGMVDMVDNSVVQGWWSYAGVRGRFNIGFLLLDWRMASEGVMWGHWGLEN